MTEQSDPLICLDADHYIRASAIDGITKSPAGSVVILKSGPHLVIKGQSPSDLRRKIPDEFLLIPPPTVQAETE